MNVERIEAKASSAGSLAGPLGAQQQFETRVINLRRPRTDEDVVFIKRKRRAGSC